LGLAVLLAALALGGAAGPARSQSPDAVCVDGGQSGRPFTGVNCTRTVSTLEAAMVNLPPGSRVVVRAFASNDANSIDGMGTYRDSALENALFASTADQPTIVEAEGFDPKANFVRPIVDGAVRITGQWQRTPGTTRTWQTAWDTEPGSFGHAACVDRIWVSRQPGKTALADFPLTRPLPNQGNDTPADCEDNTLGGQPITPQQVDAFPGSYEWLDHMLYVHLPGDEDPNGYTVEVPFRHSFSPRRGSTGLIVRGFRIYHTINGIDLWHCGGEPGNHCDATYNDTSFNTHFGLQPGRYSLLAWNTGRLNTIQLIKITSDFSEIAYNVAGPQLAQGFKLNEVADCQVHDNQVYGNRLTVPITGTQDGWHMIGARDAVAGIYLKNGTHRCEVYANTIYFNKVGVYLRNDGETLTQDNVIRNNVIVYNEVDVAWRDAGMWRYNILANNTFSRAPRLRWGDREGTLEEFLAATAGNN
jgi:parallel beta-helix repeat protein